MIKCHTNVYCIIWEFGYLRAKSTKKKGQSVAFNQQFHNKETVIEFALNDINLKPNFSVVPLSFIAFGLTFFRLFFAICLDFLEQNSLSEVLFSFQVVPIRNAVEYEVGGEHCGWLMEWITRQQPAGQPASQSASQPARASSQPASQPARQPAAIQPASSQDPNQDPGQGFKLQFPSFKFQTKIRVRVSSCNFQVSSFKPRSRSGFQVAISKFQVPNEDPGQGFKLQFPSLKFQTKIRVRVSSCNFQVSSFTPRSRSGFQDAISKFQDSHQDPGQGFKMQFPSFKIHTKIQVRVSRCNF